MIEFVRQLLIQASVHPYACAAVLIAGLALVTARLGDRGPLGRLLGSCRCRRLVRTTLVAGAAGVLLVYGIIAAWYVLLPGFAGEVEPTIASVSWALQNGAPLYHDPTAAEHYSLLYGPTVFLTNGWFLRLLGPSLPAAKAAGGLAAALGLAFLYLALRPLRSRRLALLLTAATALVYWSEGPFSYNSRPDPFLLAAVSFGLLCAVRPRRGLLAALGVAAAIGFGANLKLHSLLFFLPVLVLLGQRLGRRAVLTATVGAAFLTLAPFLLHPAISARNYVTWLLQATRHGFDGPTFVRTLLMTLFLVLPAAVVMLPGFGGGGALRRRRPYVLALLGAALLVLLPASKVGAGLVHPLPLVPLVMYLAGELLAESRRRAGSWRLALAGGRLGVVAGLGLAVLTVGAVTEYRCVRLIGWQNQGMDEVAGDIRNILATYPDQTIGMACGGEGEGFRLTYLRPLLVFAGQPLLLDAIAVMESEFADRPLPASTQAAVVEGRIDIWLVPRGRSPFWKRNWYPGHDLIFSEGFRKVFRQHHGLRDRSRYFDLWFHDGVPGHVGARIAGPARTGGGLALPRVPAAADALGPPCPATRPADGAVPRGHPGSDLR